MREYKITLNNKLASIYEEIAASCNKSTERILQDTLFKVMEIITRMTLTRNENDTDNN